MFAIPNFQKYLFNHIQSTFHVGISSLLSKGSYERFFNLLFITKGPVTNDIALLSIYNNIVYTCSTIMVP